MEGKFNGKMIIFSGPSGSGKSTIASHFLEKYDGFSFSVSACTREQRKGEIDGAHYYFLNVSEFKERIKNKEFVEYEEVYPGKYYGTMRSEVERIWKNQKHILFDIDVYGAMSIKRKFPVQSLSILVAPPSMAVLRERLVKRSTESEETLLTRLAKAEKELDFKEKFDYLLLNDDLNRAIDQAEKKIKEFILS